MSHTNPLQLARLFHETYERLAPQFGYETRADTRTFDPESANGRLMTAVCAEIFDLGARSTAAQPAGLVDEAAGQIEHLDRENNRLAREAWTWSKACEAATRKLHILSTHHPRLEVRYWTGSYWEPMYGAALDRLLETLEPAPPAAAQPVEQPSTMHDTTGTQALWPQMIAALAAIDAELGLPEDGCNSLTQTLGAIRKLKAAPPAASGDSAPPSASVQGDSTERSGYRPEAVDRERGAR